MRTSPRQIPMMRIWRGRCRCACGQRDRPKLRDEIQERVGKAGVEVIEARTHLAYAPDSA